MISLTILYTTNEFYFGLAGVGDALGRKAVLQYIEQPLANRHLLEEIVYATSFVLLKTLA